jgi:hypothetical protein
MIKLFIQHSIITYLLNKLPVVYTSQDTKKLFTNIVLVLYGMIALRMRSHSILTCVFLSTDLSELEYINNISSPSRQPLSYWITP